MAEENGNRDTRLDRIERALELFIQDHEQFRDDHKKLMIAQVLQKEAIDNLLKVTQEHTKRIDALDNRVDKLVSSIGTFISRLPPILEERIARLEAYQAAQEQAKSEPRTK
ncbi:MAG: hypothetical protein JO185_05530 [Acidobacteriaceae bacterium]|nr:hypothetical protein [Acidobacteriaceae bacterium]